MKVKSTLKFDSGEHSLEVRTFVASDTINGLFQVNVIARSLLAEVDLEPLVGKPAGLEIEGPPARVWTGVCKRAGLVRAETSDAEQGYSTYSIQIVPSLWMLSLRANNRIFQHKSIADIVKTILSEGGVDFEPRLEDTYRPLEYCVQYAETDFHFISRLMERAGISYFFEQQGSSNAKSVMILSDRPESPAPAYNLPFRDSHVGDYLDHVSTALLTHDVAPGQLTVRDYDFRRPDYALFGQSEKAQGAMGAYEQYHYLPGLALVDDGSGGGTPVADDKSTARHEDSVAQARALNGQKAQRAPRRRVDVSSNSLALAPGVVFSVEDHPHPALEKPMLIVRSETTAGVDAEPTNHVQSVFTDAPFKPEAVTTPARVPGVQSAIVVGPPGQEIHSDELGRVRVKFHWDRIGQFDDNSTCWLRVTQAWAGPAWGAMLVPRVGHEVIVDFEEGDPDRPIISGRLHNRSAVTPHVLPEHKTRSTWKSDTSPHQDGCFNEIMMEDLDGDELLYVQAQRDMRKLVKRHETERVLVDRTHVVGKSRLNAVAEVDGTQIGLQRLIRMVDVGDLKIKEQGKPEISPLETFVEIKDEKITLTVGGATVLLDGPKITVVADKGIRFTAEKNVVIWGGPNVYFNETPAKDTHPHVELDVDDAVKKPDPRIAPPIGSLSAGTQQPPKLSQPALEMRVPDGSDSQSLGDAAGDLNGDFGLAKDENRQEYADDMNALAKKWKGLATPEARLQAMQDIINKQLAKDGVPPVKLIGADLGEKAQGRFDPSTWRIEMPQADLEKSVNVAVMRRTANSLLHEGRHAQQMFDVERAYPGSLEVPASVSSAAAKAPPLTAPEKVLADKIHESYCVPSVKDADGDMITRSSYVRGLDDFQQYKSLPEEADAYRLGDGIERLIK